MRALEGDIQAGRRRFVVASTWSGGRRDPEAALFAVLFGEYTHTEYVDCYLEALSAGRPSLDRFRSPGGWRRWE